MAIGQHASSATDYSSSSTALTARALPAVRPLPGSDTVVNMSPALSRLPNPQHADVSNHTASTGVPLALAQVAEVANVFGDRAGWAGRRAGGPSQFDGVAGQHVLGRDSARERIARYLRELGEHTQSVARLVLRECDRADPLGREPRRNCRRHRASAPNGALRQSQRRRFQAADTCKTGGWRRHCISLHDFFAAGQRGVRSLRDGPGRATVGTDPVPDASITRLTQLFAKPLGAVGRLAIQQRLKGGRPTLQGYPDFVKRLSTLIEDAAERELFSSEALRLVPHTEAGPPVPPPVKSVAFVNAPPSTQKLAPPSAPMPVTPVALSAQRSALPTPPRLQPPAELVATPLPGATATDPAAKAKKSVLYRGRKIEVDE